MFWHNTSTSRQYPDIHELADRIALGIWEVNDELINSCLENIDEKKARILNLVIKTLGRNNVSCRKELLLTCANMRGFYNLKKTAFIELSKIKGDSDIEDYFVSHLIDDSDPHSELRGIANGYWR